MFANENLANNFENYKTIEPNGHATDMFLSDELLSAKWG
jgi:hypothetical protein